MKYNLSEIMRTAWRFVKCNGFTMSEALKQAWLNIKLKAKMMLGVVKFYYEKINGEIREAYGTLNNRLVPHTLGTGRRANETVQTYYDTEKGEWRCFKVANLLRIA